MHQASSRSRGPSLLASILAALFPILLLPGTAARAAAYPEKPIRLVLPFPPGGPSDILGRALADKLSQQLGQNVVADNHGGAGGNIGLALAAKSPADGYTIVLSSPTIAISPSLYAHLTYDPSELVPVARRASIQNVLIVHPSVPAKTLQQFIALARAHPGKLNFGSGGAGTTNHLANEILKSLTHIDMVHVPYKGASRAMLALLGGQVDEVVVAVPPAIPQIRAHHVRALAVLSDKRVAALPDVPTAAEAGVKNFNVSIWYGMFAPKGTPQDRIAKLSEEIQKALRSPDLAKKLTDGGVDPWPGSAADLGKLEHDERARYAAVIRKIGLKIK
jgi:tripartite-type tricarboxylate transporter receptor subunit TctC